MKRVVFLMVLFAMLLPICLVGAAEDPPVQSREVRETNENLVEIHEYLIGLPPPKEPPSLNIDTMGLSSRRLLQMVAEQEGAPLAAELSRLQAEGQILGFSLDPARYAFRVFTQREQPRLNADVAYVATAESGPPSCMVGLPDAVAEMTRASSVADAVASTTPKSVSVTPTIFVQLNAPYVNQYTYIFGSAAPNASVSMRVYRNGSLYLQWVNTTSSTGRYTMYPSYSSDCSSNGYEWYLLPGDVVEMTAGGETSRTTLVPVEASFDGTTMTLEGVTAPDRTVTYYIDYRDEDLCYRDRTDWEYTWSDSTGQFSDNPGDPGISLPRQSSVVYHVMEESNSTYSTVDSSGIGIDPDFGGVFGTVNRNASGTVKLSRGGSPLASRSFTANAKGYFSVYFDDQTFQPDDVITVQDGRQTITAKVAPADFTLDVDQDRLIGTTRPGMKVRASFNSGNDLNVQNSCTSGYQCATTTAGSDGSINIPADLDLRPGDFSYIMLYDEQGNSQYVSDLYAPTIVAGPGVGYILGYWDEPYVDVTIRLYGPGNTLKYEETTATSYNGRFLTYYFYPAVGDRVEVSHGSETRSMVIQDFTGRLNSVDDKLSLAGPNRPYVATYWDYDGYALNDLNCYERTISGGQDAINLSGRVDAGDSATVSLAGADGNYTLLDLAAFKAYVTLDDDYVRARTETTNSQFTLRHERDSSVLYEETVNADGGGYVDFFLDEPVQDQDRLIFTGLGSESGINVDMKLPTLTYSTVGNTVQGSLTSPSASYPVMAWMVRDVGHQMWSAFNLATSNPSGAFEVPINPLYLGGTYRLPCVLTALGGSCVGVDVRYLLNGHSVTSLHETPPPIAADSYESDNTPATAKQYQDGVQYRTFHATTDVDWVKVDVPIWAVGWPVTFRVLDMGWGVAVSLDLYEADGTTLVNDQAFHDYGEEIFLEWTPDEAGTYLLQISPMDDKAAGHCDAYYHFRIDFAQIAQIALPAVMK